MSELVIPKYWKSATISECIAKMGLISDGDWIESKDQDPSGSIRLIQLADIGDGSFRNKSHRFMTKRNAERMNCTFLSVGDVIIARMPDPLGRACIFPEIENEAVTVVDICLIRACSNSAFINKILMHWINSPEVRNYIAMQSTGTTRKRITRKKIEALELPVPSLAEQKEIATKLDKLLTQVDTIKARLDTIPDILKRFRQSVLAAAVNGKLTEEWRKKNSTDPIGELDVYISDSNNDRKKIEATNHHEIITDLIPPNWSITNFNNLFKFIDYRGKTPKKSTKGKRLISAKNIKMGFVQNEPIEYLSEKDYQSWMTRGFPKPGDIFFVTEGHTMGCVALNERDDEFALAQRTITLQPFNKLNTRFYLYYMLTSQFQRLVELNATGSAAKGIKAAKFRGLPTPFPSSKEQDEIVRQIEQLFIFADQIEKRVKDAQTRVNKLTQSILTKAFRGELTAEWREQNPDLISGENSAEALLEKIKKEREAIEKAKPKKKRTRIPLRKNASEALSLIIFEK